MAEAMFYVLKNTAVVVNMWGLCMSKGIVYG